MDEGGLAEEIELLEAIYIEELEVQKNEKNEVDKITLQLHPSTGEDLEKRYVCMTLILGLSTQYPDVPPEIIIKNPRGIAEEEILSLREDMHKLCEERKGGPVLYELIELAKDSLTAGNIPHCPCMICLEHFHEGEKFTKTECYHYFHENCLMRYVSHVLTQTPEIVPVHSMPTPAANKLVCPVCREEIHCKFDELDMSPVEDKFVFVPTPELLEMQERMASMYEEQKAKGGIIDVEAERNKYLIKHGDVVLLPPPMAESNRKPDNPDSVQSMSEMDHQENNKSEERKTSGERDKRNYRSERDKRNYRSERDNRNYRSERDNRNYRSERDNRNYRSERDNRNYRIERDDRNYRSERDNKNYRSERNDRSSYTRGKGRGYRNMDCDSSRDGDKRWHNRRDEEMSEKRYDGNTVSKAETEAYISSDNNSVQDNSNKPGLESRGKGNRNKERDYHYKDRSKAVEKKEPFVKETDDNPNCSENPSNKTEERTRNVRKGFGRPQRKDRDERDIKEIGTGSQDDNFDYDAKESSGTNSERNMKDEKDRAVVNNRGNSRRFQGNRGGFGRPQRKDRDERDIEEIGTGSQDDNLDYDAKESSGTNSERNMKDEKDRAVVNNRGNSRRFQGNRGGFGRPPRRGSSNKEDDNFRTNNQSPRSGGFERLYRGNSNKEGENFRTNNQSPRSGGFGKPYTDDLKDEDRLREKPRQNRGGFGKPDRYSNKESPDETSQPVSDNGGKKKDPDRSSGRNYGDNFGGDDASRKGEYDNREREGWKQQTRNERSDERFKYPSEERSYNYGNDRRNQGKDKSRYSDRGGRGFGRGRGHSAKYQPRKQYDNQSYKSQSYNRNKSPRDKDTESVDLKLDKMVLSDNHLDCSDNKRSESSSKDKNEICNEGSKHLSTPRGEKMEYKSDCMTGPPGFLTKCPPGFETESIEGKSKSVVKPPPGFKS